jgi:spermidine/putrescine transport system permease protein
MDDASPQSTSRGWIALLTPTWVILGVFFLLPLCIIFALSFGRGDAFGGYEPIENLPRYLRRGEFLGNYIHSLQPRFLGVFWRSIWIAVLTTGLCTLISFPAAYYIAVVCPARWKSLLLILVVVPFWTSFLIRTYAWMMILRDEGLVNRFLMSIGLTHSPLPLLYNDLSVMIGLVYGELPFMILPLYASLEKLDRSLLEASADLGAGGWSTFFRVTLPLTAPGLAAGIVLVFIPSIGQFVVSDLLGGAKSILIGNLVQSQFAASSGTVGDKPFGAAIAFELTAVVLLLLLAYAFYAKRRGAEVLL